MRWQRATAACKRTCSRLEECRECRNARRVAREVRLRVKAARITSVPDLVGHIAREPAQSPATAPQHQESSARQKQPAQSTDENKGGNDEKESNNDESMKAKLTMKPQQS